MGKFVIKKSKNDQYVFNLLAANGQVICTSETYKALDGAKNGIESVRKNCTAEIEDQTVEGYKAKKSALNGIDSIQRNAPDAEVVEELE